MANKRITDVDFLESLNSDESFFVNQNNTLKQINKGDVTFDIVNGGTGAKDAATARANLGAADSKTVNEIGTSLSDLRNDFDEYVATNAVIAVDKGGTGSNDGATGLKNLFAAGNTILSPYQYGTDLPTEVGNIGRIFFKIVTSETATTETE